MISFELELVFFGDEFPVVVALAVVVSLDVLRPVQIILSMANCVVPCVCL